MTLSDQTGLICTKKVKGEGKRVCRREGQYFTLYKPGGALKIRENRNLCILVRCVIEKRKEMVQKGDS